MSCVNQEISSFKTEEICIETKQWYENFPEDKQGDWKLVLYTCKPRDSHEI